MVANRGRDDHELPAARRHPGGARVHDDRDLRRRADVVNDEDQSVPDGSDGYLVLEELWPAMSGWFGRVDEVTNVAGPGAPRSAVSQSRAAEAAVLRATDEMTGQAVRVRDPARGCRRT